MDSAGIDALLPPWIQAVITLGGAAVVYAVASWGKLRNPNPISEVVTTRTEFMETFRSETLANREVLQINRDLLTAIRDNTLRIAISNEEIARLVLHQVSDARDADLAERVAERLNGRIPPRQR